jgi:hypothetical protein
MAVLITFNCYGTHLRGDRKGSVDRLRGERGGLIEPCVALEEYGRRIMAHPAVQLNLCEAQLVLRAIRETCTIRGWTLLAVHVRSTHAHVVVDGVDPPSSVLRDLKAYASRALSGSPVKRRWARGGNVKTLTAAPAIRAAVRYVADSQGPPMAVYVNPIWV